MKDDKMKNPMDFGEQILEKIGDSFNDVDFGELSDTIRASVDYIRQEAEKGYRNYQESISRQYQKAEKKIKEQGRYQYNAAGRYREETGNQSRNLPILQKIPGRVQGPVEMGLGITAMVVFGGLSLGFGITTLVTSMMGVFFSGVSSVLLGIFLPLTAAGGGLLGHGIFSKNRAKRLLKYEEILRGKDYVMLENLAKSSGQKMEQIKKDIKYIMENKLAPGLSMDKKKTCLLISDSAKEQYLAAEQARIQREEEEKRLKEEEELRNRQKTEGTKEEREWIYFQEVCSDFLEELQQKKSEIDTPVMQEHISRVEILLSQIFVCVKEHPEMVLNTGHLASYYLPCMSKLLRTYEDLEEQPIQGENIRKTKHEIEVSFETIEDAMTNMYDELFQEVSMDISSDIQVLKAMMAQDGWGNRIKVDNKEITITND